MVIGLNEHGVQIRIEFLVHPARHCFAWRRLPVVVFIHFESLRSQIESDFPSPGIPCIPCGLQGHVGQTIYLAFACIRLATCVIRLPDSAVVLIAFPEINPQMQIIHRLQPCGWIGCVRRTPHMRSTPCLPRGLGADDIKRNAVFPKSPCCLQKFFPAAVFLKATMSVAEGIARRHVHAAAQFAEGMDDFCEFGSVEKIEIQSTHRGFKRKLPG